MLTAILIAAVALAVGAVVLGAAWQLFKDSNVYVSPGQGEPITGAVRWHPTYVLRWLSGVEVAAGVEIPHHRWSLRCSLSLGRQTRRTRHRAYSFATWLRSPVSSVRRRFPSGPGADADFTSAALRGSGNTLCLYSWTPATRSVSVSRPVCRITGMRGASSPPHDVAQRPVEEQIMDREAEKSLDSTPKLGRVDPVGHPAPIAGPGLHGMGTWSG